MDSSAGGSHLGVLLHTVQEDVHGAGVEVCVSVQRHDERVLGLRQTTCGHKPIEGRKHGALRPQKPLRIIRDGEVGGSGIYESNTCSLRYHHQNGSALRWAAARAILMFH